MRFKIGSKVEVLTKKKDPSGVWRCAEIVAYNGDGYTVRYYRCADIVKEGVDKVSGEAVRPCPPLVTDSMVWVVGDVVEVLDGGYWKVSVIEEDMGGNCYQIRVIGSIDEFRVKKSNIRMRQEWKDDKWVLLGKDSGNCEDMITRMRKKARMLQQGDFINVQPIGKSLKRSFSGISSTDEGYSECMQKRRSVNKEAAFDAIHGDSYSSNGKVVSMGGLKEIYGGRTEFSSSGSRRPNDAMFLARTSNASDCVSSLSSVASCSVIDPLYDRVLSHASTNCSQDADSLCSDAESSNPLGDEEGNSVGEWQDAFKTHELDLLSYRHILEALYASGPLSWEQEILLTNLRMKLYVSNDEHLMELRRLRSIGGVALSCH